MSTCVKSTCCLPVSHSWPPPVEGVDGEECRENVASTVPQRSLQSPRKIKAGNYEMKESYDKCKGGSWEARLLIEEMGV